MTGFEPDESMLRRHPESAEIKAPGAESRSKHGSSGY
jgi:hypothetical protein